MEVSKLRFSFLITHRHTRLLKRFRGSLGNFIINTKLKQKVLTPAFHYFNESLAVRKAFQMMNFRIPRFFISFSRKKTLSFELIRCFAEFSRNLKSHRVKQYLMEKRLALSDLHEAHSPISHLSQWNSTYLLVPRWKCTSYKWNSPREQGKRKIRTEKRQRIQEIISHFGNFLFSKERGSLTLATTWNVLEYHASKGTQKNGKLDTKCEEIRKNFLLVDTDLISCYENIFRVLSPSSYARNKENANLQYYGIYEVFWFFKLRIDKCRPIYVQGGPKVSSPPIFFFKIKHQKI